MSRRANSTSLPLWDAAFSASYHYQASKQVFRVVPVISDESSVQLANIELKLDEHTQAN